jgi:hypothetical protein
MKRSTDPIPLLPLPWPGPLFSQSLSRCASSCLIWIGGGGGIDEDPGPIHAMEWIRIHSWPQIPLTKTAFGKGEHSLGPLPIHANRHGNLATPSEAGKWSLSHDGSQRRWLSRRERWRRLSPGDGAPLLIRIEYQSSRCRITNMMTTCKQPG